MTSANELQRLLLQNAAFTPPPRIVMGIPAAARAGRPAGVPHSIAEELWHITYWLELFLRWARCEPLAYPSLASEGWSTIETVDEAHWNNLVERFKTGLAALAEIAGQADLATRLSTLEEPGAGTGPLSLSELVVNAAVHNAYHLGRIVQLRQMQQCWPPPVGGDTW
jgi:uncharacterized damage-inducible protein DinB